jgi:lipopolysaccharide/colanic/teichoic acid biosynthesis glycosyltransferase
MPFPTTLSIEYKFHTTCVRSISVSPCGTYLASGDEDSNLVIWHVQTSRILRKYKLDELPQLWNILRGEMSLVGPRPCLFNQTDLISERASLGVFDARPGITGLAQLNNIDMSTPKLLAETDARMLREMTIANYLKYVFLTLSGKGSGDRVKAK